MAAGRTLKVAVTIVSYVMISDRGQPGPGCCAVELRTAEPCSRS